MTPWTIAFSVPAVFQARILDRVAISFSRDLPNPGITPVPLALAGEFFTAEPPGNNKADSGTQKAAPKRRGSHPLAPWRCVWDTGPVSPEDPGTLLRSVHVDS